MFLVSDSQGRRHAKIRSFLKDEPVIAILLAAVDFEWTVRRAIVAMGHGPNRRIREELLVRCHGAEDYKEAWKAEVVPRFGSSLPSAIPNWSTLKGDAYPLRHRVVHGTVGIPPREKNRNAVEAFLAASTSLAEFAAANQVELFGKRLPVRRKALVLP